MNDKYTESARAAITQASEIAYQLSHNYVGTEHLLIGLLKADGVASKVLEKNGVEVDKVVELVNQLIARRTLLDIITSLLTPDSLYHLGITTLLLFNSTNSISNFSRFFVFFFLNSIL